MLASEWIEAIKQAIAEHGDLPVYFEDSEYGHQLAEDIRFVEADTAMYISTATGLATPYDYNQPDRLILS
jgi:hypothetical protein